jgi:membrane protein required for beta-lactamase induction
VQQEARGPSLIQRLVALVVLVVCAWILLKIVLGILAGVSTLIVVVLAIVGVVWALGKF